MNTYQNDTRPKMLIIDGSSILTTCYYANLPLEVKTAKTDEEKEKSYSMILHSSDGTYTNGILGFCKILVRFINEWKPDYIVTAFDKSRKTTFRKQMYEDYKGQRKTSPAPLKEQLRLIQQILYESRIPVLISDRYEADDLAGSVAEKYKEEMQIALLTKDGDYLQLVDDDHHVKCFLMTEEPKAKQFREYHGIPTPELSCMRNIMEFTDFRVQSEKGVLPKNIVDLKAIEGDTSDNIPGVKGVSSAAAPLISYYGSIEAIYKAIEKDTSKKALKELADAWKEELGIKRSPINALISGKESAVLSKTLATIKRDIMLPDLTMYPAQNMDKVKFQNWMERLGIRTITV